MRVFIQQRMHFRWEIHAAQAILEARVGAQSDGGASQSGA